MYLFELCNRINWAIHHGQLEEIFLLKYAVFSLKFLNKLDSKLDREFYSQLLSDFKQNQKYYQYLLKDIQMQNTSKSIERKSMSSFSLLNNSTEAVYQNRLDKVFQSCLTNSSILAHETAKFNLLPINIKVDLAKV